MPTGSRPRLKRQHLEIWLNPGTFFTASALERAGVSLHFGSMEQTQLEPPPREPIFQAPWPAVVLVGFILTCFAVQLWLGVERTDEAWGLSPAGLAQGRWFTL